MIPVIQEKRRPSFMESLGAGIREGLPETLGQIMQMRQMQQENRTLGNITGENLSGLSPDLKKVYLQNLMRKKEEKRDLNTTFGGILEEMKSLVDNVGPFKLAKLNPFSETAGKRSQIDTLRLSLEGLFRELTLKGQFPKAIYERILKELPSSNDTPEQYLNRIKAIEKILGSHFGGEEGSPSKEGKVQFNPENKEHRAKAQQLYKTHKDKEKVRELLSREFEGL